MSAQPPPSPAPAGAHPGQASAPAGAQRVAPRVALVAVALALASALFFTSTYVLNRASVDAGGHWAWMAALRYLITLPLLVPLLLPGARWRPVLASIARAPGPWLLWSGVGFGLFYALLSWGASAGPSWLVAGAFQFTVVAGMLCAPFLYTDSRARVPKRALAIGAVIVLGVLLMQLGHAGGWPSWQAWLAVLAVLGAAVAYPLGNRALLLHLEREAARDAAEGRDVIVLDATQRVFGLTLASQPAWIALALFAYGEVGAPSGATVALAAGVALGAGIIATVLFFRATGMVRHDPVALGAAEAMQAAEIVFAALIGAWWLGEALPGGLALVGMLVVGVGIAGISLLAARPAARDDRRAKALRSTRGA